MLINSRYKDRKQEVKWLFVTYCILYTCLNSCHTTVQSCSQFFAKENVGQLALSVALLRGVVFINVNVVKVYLTCKKCILNRCDKEKSLVV